MLKWLRRLKRSPTPVSKAAGKGVSVLNREVIQRVERKFYASRFEVDLDQRPTGVDTMLAQARLEFGSVLASESISDFMPRLPSVLPRIIRLLRDPDSTANQLVSLITEDPTLVAKVLSLANSPYFRRTEAPLDSLQVAIIYLGAEGLQALVNASVMQPILSVPNGVYRELSSQIYAQALTCASLGEILAREKGHNHSIQHLCGLLQATGDVAILGYTMKVLAAMPDQPRNFLTAEFCVGYGRQVAAATARGWKLGADIEAVLAADGVDANPCSEAAFAGQVRCAAQIKTLFDDGIFDHDAAAERLQALGMRAEVLTRRV